MTTNLKLESFSLAAQARILKKLGRSVKKDHAGAVFATAHIQRNAEKLRKEARAVHIARGFLRGRELIEMELPYRAHNEGHISRPGHTRTLPDFRRIEVLIKSANRKYETEQELLQRWAEFIDGASIGVPN